MFKYVEVKEGVEFQVYGKDSEVLDMVVLHCADGHEFAVLSSFIAQEVGPLRSPYGDYELVFHQDDVSFSTLEGEIVHASEVEYIFPENVVKDDTPVYFPSGT